jgi:hypothetical protein
MPTKPLAPFPHAVLDYALGVAFLVAPSLLAFDSPAARTGAYAAGALYLAASLVTRYPLGALKWLPFPVHGVLETLMAAAWIVLPWLARFAEPAPRYFFVAAGIALLALASLTDYAAADGYPARERRRGKIDRRLRSLDVVRDRRIASGPRRRLGRSVL